MTTIPKRRLSIGNALVDITKKQVNGDNILDREEDNENSGFVKKSGSSRRRSSFGASSVGSRSPVINPVEQSRIAEMYKTVIQMSSENKLNEKNSWNYDLIDHMGKLIKDDSRDASVKIYSNRVDDTYATSHRILECLSRNGNNEGVDNNNEEKQPGVKAKVGSKAASSRLNVAETIEKNPEVLNAVKLENDYSVDPLFHKMSKAFDEGGAKGMLMNNMRLSSDSCSISFNFKLPEEDKPTEITNEEKNVVSAEELPPNTKESISNNEVDVSDLILHSGIDVSDLLSLCICPALDIYRDQIGVTNNLTGCLPIDISSSLRRPPVTFAIPTNSSNDFYDQTDDDAMDTDEQWVHQDNNDNDNDYSFEQENKDHEEQVIINPQSTNNSTSNANKLQWDPLEPTQEGVDLFQNDSLKLAAEDQEYAFFDAEALTKDNSWAGAKHWKYATRRRAPEKPVVVDNVDNNNNVNVETDNKKKRCLNGKQKATEAATKIEFFSALVDESLFELVGRNQADPTLLSDKTSSEADVNSLFLPVDAKLQLKDLCRLFLAPKVIVPPSLSAKNSIILSAKNSANLPANVVKDMFSDEGKDRLWGKPVLRQAVAPMDYNNNNDDDDNNDYYVHNDDDYDNDGGDQNQPVIDNNNYDNNDNNDNKVDVVTGLTINQSKLLQANRTVEKINIGYAKVSKRVNIQRLKSDIWSNIKNNLIENEEEEDDNNNNNNNKNENLSFQNMISSLAINPRQKDVTLPFYFICLLHLANENTLKIEDVDDMSDLIISMDNK